ncbi:unnamed protein product [Ilex paraguariensis]|uniref:Mitochondrial import inner membrane translocase subunit TIM22 n=1 Tax=Ilex paraguariensis TaxID=185542 RepID=A0ABC8UY30_9AQUA
MMRKSSDGQEKQQKQENHPVLAAFGVASGFWGFVCGFSEATFTGISISGNFGVAKDALAEVASRLRTRFLRDANAGAEPGPVGPVPRFPRFGHSGNLSGAGPPPPAGSGGYEMLKDGQEKQQKQENHPVLAAFGVASGFWGFVCGFSEATFTGISISGNFGVAKDALAEVASRLRTRFLRDANAGAEPGPVGPVPRFPRFGHSGNLSGAGPPPPAGSGGYEMLKVYLTKALYIRVRRSMFRFVII